MKTLKIFMLAILALGLFNSCSKDEFSSDKFNSERKAQPSIENQNLLKDYISISSRSKSATGDYLHFSTIEELEDYYDNLKSLSKEWDYDSEESKEYNEEVAGDPAIYSFNEHIGFFSLGQYYDELDLVDENYRDNVPDYIGTPIFQQLLSDKKEIAIGNNIYKVLEMDRIAVISDLSNEGLEHVRENTIHSDHSNVEFFTRGDGTSSKIIPIDDFDDFDDWDDWDDCFTYLSVIPKTYKGSNANKVTLRSRINGLPEGCEGAVTSQIDWGDGTTSYGLSGDHEYSIPSWITSEDCVEFTITVTSEWIMDCGECEKGKINSRTIKVELCPEDDCTQYEGPGEKRKTFDYAWAGNTYRLIGEIGVDNGWAPIPFFDRRHVWSKSTLYRKQSNGSYKKWRATVIKAKLHGPIWRELSCSVPDGHGMKKVFDAEVDLEVGVNKKSVTYEYCTSWSRPIFTKEFDDDQLFSDHAVRLGNHNEEILNVTLWD